MKKTKISFYFVFISFFTLLTIFFSIVQKSYFSFITPQKIIENDSLLNDFNPNLDLTVISTIESKNKNIDELFDFSIIKSNQASNKNTPTPTIAPQITENPTSKEATTSPVPSVKSGGSVSTSTQ